MSTRSFVAVRDTNGVARGRYVHSDGYPERVGAAVKKIVDRVGVAAARKVLIEDYYGWSTVTGDKNPQLMSGTDDGRFVAVPGFGVAYTTFQGQSSEEEWYTEGDEDSDMEYMHVINPDGTVTSSYVDGTPIQTHITAPPRPVNVNLVGVLTQTRYVRSRWVW